MIRFFAKDIIGNSHILYREDAYHAIKSLRVKLNEKIVICDKNSVEHLCKVTKISDKELYLAVLESKKCQAEPDVKITLYQSLPKNDKMELIVQKAVELGVFEIVPTLSERCISKPDEKALSKKIERWQKIAKEAAQQSGRGIVPKILPAVSLENAAKNIASYEKALIFYENGGESIKNSIQKTIKNLAIFIGPEGGFEKAEVNLLAQNGAVVSTLGKRILRTETASLAALAVIFSILE